MSPEQLKGKDADARSDLFAFGAVLYEMLTGSRAFDEGSQTELVAAILEREPAPLATRQPLAPPALDRVVATCLAKDPDDRWQTARDLLRELTWVRTDLTESPPRRGRASRRQDRAGGWRGDSGRRRLRGDRLHVARGAHAAPGQLLRPSAGRHDLPSRHC